MSADGVDAAAKHLAGLGVPPHESAQAGGSFFERRAAAAQAGRDAA